MSWLFPADPRFDALVVPEPNSGCWIWIGTRDEDGYGAVIREGKRLRAHRYAYEMLFGAIPVELVIDHLCCNTSCCNPWHMEPVASSVNTRRAHTRAIKPTECPKGHPFAGDNLIYSSHGHRLCRECRREGARLRKRRALWGPSASLDQLLDPRDLRPAANRARAGRLA